MATVGYRIVSPYTAPDEEKEIVPHKVALLGGSDDPWQTDSFFGPRRLTRPVNFLPATYQYDECGMPLLSHQTAQAAKPPKPDPSFASWYRSLPRSLADINETRVNEALASRSPHSTPRSPLPPLKKDWFISRALQDHPPRTLADMISQDAPPLPSEPRFIPPVWIALGPSNKGFAMLQKSGWHEGEGLGAHTIRQEPIKKSPPNPKWVKFEAPIPVPLAGESQQVEEPEEERLFSKLKVINSRVNNEGPQSDDFLIESRASPVQPSPFISKPLLTPLATTLKSDRLGIGSGKGQKAITHSWMALQSHHRVSNVQKQHLQNARRLRSMQTAVGRGHRGFERLNKGQERQRLDMLAYMKAD